MLTPVVPARSEHKGKELRLWSFMPPHMLSFQINWMVSAV